MSDDILTMEYAETLGELMTAVKANRKLRWYPLGTDTDNPLSVVMRTFTYQNGNFYSGAEDIREAYLWLSGMMEHWIKVSDVVNALINARTARFGSDKPMAVIE